MPASAKKMASPPYLFLFADVCLPTNSQISDNARVASGNKGARRGKA